MTRNGDSLTRKSIKNIPKLASKPQTGIRTIMRVTTVSQEINPLHKTMKPNLLEI